MSTFFSASGGSPPCSSRFRGLFPGQVAPAVVPALVVSNHGSIFLLEPQTDAAVAWVDEHLPSDHLLFGASIVVERRYIADIVAGIQRDGLVLR
jgi:hypothetical protein